MRKSISIMLVLAFVGAAYVAQAQPTPVNDGIFNRNYIFGDQDKDDDGNLRWNANGTPRMGPVKASDSATSDFLLCKP